MKRMGATQKKFLLLLGAGLALALSRNPRQQFRILNSVAKEWRKINSTSLYRAIRSLYESKLIDSRDGPDGSAIIVLNENGRRRVMSHKLEEIKIKKPSRWDRKWRMVIFDIPESFKRSREAMRFHLRRLGFHQLQKSVFIFPYQCRDEIEFLIEFYQLRPYIRQVIAEHVDNELHLKKVFKLI